jgi:hypothetical protein
MQPPMRLNCQCQKSQNRVIQILKRGILVSEIDLTLLLLVLGNLSSSPPMSFSPKGSCFYDRPNSLLLIIEPFLFTHLIICGRFGGKIGELLKSAGKKNTVHITLFTSVAKLQRWNGGCRCLQIRGMVCRLELSE